MVLSIGRLLLPHARGGQNGLSPCRHERRQLERQVRAVNWAALQRTRSTGRSLLVTTDADETDTCCWPDGFDAAVSLCGVLHRMLQTLKDRIAGEYRMAERNEEMIRGTRAEQSCFRTPKTDTTVLQVRTEQAATRSPSSGTIPMTRGWRAAGRSSGKWGRATRATGQQFEAEFSSASCRKTTQRDPGSYLSSRAVKGIGPRTAAKIVGTIRRAEPRPCSSSDPVAP
ncbi:MAG: hypothetical protein ACLR8L_00400 [Oscillospiraceae bacterium]